MKKKKIFKLTVSYITSFLLAAMLAFPLNVKASSTYEDDLNAILNASKGAITSIEKLGFSMNEIDKLPKKDASFYNITLDDFANSINVPENYQAPASQVANSYSTAGGYQKTFVKQMSLINKAALENKARGLSTMNCSMEEEVKFQFISHYIDGNQGGSAYFSEYGYQSFNMADWVTDMDRKEYRRVLGTLMNSKQLKETASIAKDVYSVAESKYFFEKSAKKMSDTAGHVAEVGSEILGNLSIEQKNEMIAEASSILQYSDTIVEFQTAYAYYLDHAFMSSIDEAGKDILGAAMSTIVFSGMTLTPLGLAVTCAYYTLTLGADVLATRNLLALGMSRQARVSERVMDYMEFEGY